MELKPIRTRKDYQSALAEIELLWDAPARSARAGGRCSQSHASVNPGDDSAPQRQPETAGRGIGQTVSTAAG